MAKSEHQGMQIALISFALVSVLLAIVAFVYYRESEEAAKIAAAEKEKADAATARANDFQARVDYVLHILGVTPRAEADVEQLKQSFAEDADMKGIVASYEQFIDTFGAGMPKERLNYQAVGPQVLSSLEQRNGALIQQTAESAKMAKDLQTTIAKEAERTGVAAKAQQDAEKLLEQERGKYEQDRKSLESKQTTQLASFDQERSKRKQEVDDAAKRVADSDTKLKGAETVIRQQVDEIKKLRDVPFEVADGDVTGVNQTARTVWINLGMADGLRRQTLFSVFDQADNGVTRAEAKASIEVTRVLGQHLAEARIIADEPGNPILRGDQIFSPAWRPGRRVRFALVGLIDLDGDRRSDRNLVRSLLSASGGQVDAEMHDDGHIEGEITPATRYLVLGEQPNERSDPKVLASYTKMRNDAQGLGVELIRIDELLTWVGYRPEVRTVGLGKNAEPGQWKPQPPEGKAPTSSGNVSGGFKERSPTDKLKNKGAKKSSAFDK